MKRRRNGMVRELAVTLVVFAMLFVAAFVLLDYIGTASDTNQADIVQQAVRNAVLTCYAVEGRYPSDVEYLRENYGLNYAKDRYIIYLDTFASNVMPEIRVSEKGAAGK